MGLSRCKPAILEWPSLYITLLGLVKYLALPITNITFSILGWSIINNTPWTQWLISYQKMGGVSKSPPQKGLLIPNLMALPHIRGVLMWKKNALMHPQFMVYWWAQIGMIYTPKFLIIGDCFLGIPTKPTWQEPKKIDLARSEFHFWHPDTSPSWFHPISMYLYTDYDYDTLSNSYSWKWVSTSPCSVIPLGTQPICGELVAYRDPSWQQQRQQPSAASWDHDHCGWSRGDPFVPLWHNGGVWNCWKGVKRETTIQTQKYVGMRKLVKLDGLLIFVVFTFVFDWPTDIERGAGQKLETCKVPRTCELPNHWG